MDKRWLLRFTLLTLALCWLAGPAVPAAPPAGDSPAPAKFAPGEVLVKFKDATPAKITPGPAVRGVEAQADLPVQAQAALARVRGKVKKAYAHVGLQRVQIPDNLTVGQAIEALYRSGAVEYAEPNYPIRARADTPNDPGFVDGSLWGLHNTGQNGGAADADIDAPEGWGIRTDASTTIVGVLDTGIDYNHEDLKANMWVNPNEIPGNGIDDDGNGYIDDVYGIDAYQNNGNPMDTDGHGTHVAGIIGARGDNGKGVTGIAWTAKLMALRCMNNEWGGNTGDVIECLNYVLAIKQANPTYTRIVLNNSYNSDYYSQALFDAIKVARGQGILLVASSGWLDTDVSPVYPAGLDLHNIIAVGSSNRQDSRYDGNEFGFSSVDLFAPGADIYSTLPGNAYGYKSGSSMAAAYVSGACALVWSKRPDLPWTEIKGLILNGTENGQTPDFARRCVTQGRLNLARSLAAARVKDPAIFAVKPPVADAGLQVTLTGCNFGTSGTLKFRGVTVPTSSWTDKAIVFTVPAGLPQGYGALQVATGAGASRTSAFANMRAAAVAGQLLLGRQYACGARVGNNFWTIGGRTYWGLTGLVESYNLNTGAAQMQSEWMMPQPAIYAGAAAIGPKIYVVGGLDEEWQHVNTLQVFDTVAKTWETRAVPPGFFMDFPAVVSQGDKLYIFSDMVTLEYDPATDVWTPKAPAPVPSVYAAGTRYGNAGKIWLLGGYADYGTANKVRQYDTVADTWSDRPDLVYPHVWPAAVNYKNRVFCLQGYDANWEIQKAAEYFTTKWVPGVFISQPLYAPMAACLTDKIYVIGGSTYNYLGQGLSRNVWRFTNP